MGTHRRTGNHGRQQVTSTYPGIEMEEKILNRWNKVDKKLLSDYSTQINCNHSFLNLRKSRDCIMNPLIFSSVLVCVSI